MSDIKMNKRDGPPNIDVNDDLEFEDGHESDTLLKKKGSTPANYGSLRPDDQHLLESTAESTAQRLKGEHKLSGNFTPKTVDIPHNSLMIHRNRSVSRMSISSTSSKNFKPKISNRVPLLGLNGTPRGSASRGGRKFSNASNYLLPRTTTVIEKENSTDGSDSKELDAKSDISMS